MKLQWMGIALAALLTACQFHSDAKIDNDWITYKSRFVAVDGRIIDTGNNGVSHSEGQGYGLLLALRMHDEKLFKHIWQWTKLNLQVRKDSLFIWRRRPATAISDEDKNNATDGDIIIAWALLEASKNWKQTGYKNEAITILNDIKNKLIFQKNGLDIILPGEYGFQLPESTIINLSYWIYPAFKIFSEFDNDPVWAKLTASGQILMQKARFGLWQLPPDWLEIKNDGSMTPARNKQFGYDAVRVPLYSLLGGISPELLSPFAKYWYFYQGYTPSWIALEDNIMDSYGASSGIKAIKEVTLFALKSTDSVKFASIDNDQDYYSATLLLLSKLAYQQLAD
jgi:endo-1,4-beta-D-glucanase Y